MLRHFKNGIVNERMIAVVKVEEGQRSYYNHITLIMVNNYIFCKSCNVFLTNTRKSIPLAADIHFFVDVVADIAHRPLRCSFDQH